ncbi:hypothetical protein GC170_00120 [bacterium]|nr:hypothetical protein [bacterium]
MPFRIISKLRNLFAGPASSSPSEDRQAQLRQRFGLLYAHNSRGDAAAAKTESDQIERLLDSWYPSDPDSASGGDLIILANGYMALAQVRRETDQPEASIAHSDKATEILNQLRSRAPGDMETHGDLAACCNSRGLCLSALGRKEDALHQYRQAVAHREEIRKQQPGDELNVVYLGGVYCNMGQAEMRLENPDAALRHLETSIDILTGSIQGCDCGCRDALDAQLAAQLGSAPPVRTALSFLNNALISRESILGPEALLKHTSQTTMTIERSDGHGKMDFVIVIIDCESISDDPPGRLNELRLDLLQGLFTNFHPVVFDFSRVRSMDQAAIKLFRHIRSQLVGSRRWPIVIGLTEELARATPEMRWHDDFDCQDSIEGVIQNYISEHEDT